MLVVLLLGLLHSLVEANIHNFLLDNRLPVCGEFPERPRLGLSYFIRPADYYDNVPENERIPAAHADKQPYYDQACGRVVTVAELNAYEFQTEHFLTATGLNIYDGSLRAMALSLLGSVDEAVRYSSLIQGGATCQFADVRGDAACKGVLVQGTCSDPTHTGDCGFCYGDGNAADSSEPKENAWTFRMIADYWALDGTVDARCPEKNFRWTWNDYRPILGENSWANLIGPMQVALQKFGSIAAIPNDDISIQIAIDFLPSLRKQYYVLGPGYGAVAYAPKNTLMYANKDGGFDFSVENNISLLAGLKALRYLLVQKDIHLNQIGDLNTWIDGITAYIRASLDPEGFFFRQGGSIDVHSGNYNWVSGNISFAVDCQTWAMTVVNPLQIDSWFGVGASEKIWENTKALGGYHYNSNTGRVDGLGFTENSQSQVLSGEWSYGAINMLRVFSRYYPERASEFLEEEQQMLTVIGGELRQTFEHQGRQWETVSYANKRYWIPFGWWANPLPSVASSAWAAMLDNSFNPFHLGGAYVSDY